MAGWEEAVQIRERQREGRKDFLSIFSIFTVRTAFDSLVERHGEREMRKNKRTRISRVPGRWRWSGLSGDGCGVTGSSFLSLSLGLG